VRDKTHGTKRILHPQVGELELFYESFAVNGGDGQMLVAYHAEPGSRSARALALLSSIVAGEPSPADRAAVE